MDIDILISQVEKHSILWDASDLEYKDKLKKHEAWLDVARAVIPNFGQKTEAEKKVIVQEVTSKWRSVRDNYVRALKKRSKNNRPGSAAKRKMRYVYEEQLAFLKKYREPRPSSGTIETEDSEAENIVSNQLEVIDTSNEEANDEIAGTCKYRPHKRSKKIKLEDNLASLLECKQSINDEDEGDDDKDMTFYKSTLPLIKSFTLEQKIQFRMQVMQLIQNIRTSNIHLCD